MRDVSANTSLTTAVTAAATDSMAWCVLGMEEDHLAG